MSSTYQPGKVLILQGDSYKAVGSIFEKRGYEVLYTDETLSQANLVVFTGGSDVSPYIYGEEPAGARGCDPVRDEYEKEVYELAVSKGIPCIGICRGHQFLSALNGADIIQDHGLISGMIELDGIEGNNNVVIADHHQGVLSNGGKLLSTAYVGNGVVVDYEVYYPETLTLGVQYHPEWSHEGTETRFFDLIEEYID